MTSDDRTDAALERFVPQCIEPSARAKIEGHAKLLPDGEKSRVDVRDARVKAAVFRAGGSRELSQKVPACDVVHAVESKSVDAELSEPPECVCDVKTAC